MFNRAFGQKHVRRKILYAELCTQTTGSTDSENSKNCSDIVADKNLLILFYLVIVKIFITSVNLASFVEYVHVKRKTSNHLPI